VVGVAGIDIEGELNRQMTLRGIVSEMIGQICAIAKRMKSQLVW